MAPSPNDEYFLSTESSNWNYVDFSKVFVPHDTNHTCMYYYKACLSAIAQKKAPFVSTTEDGVQTANRLLRLLKDKKSKTKRQVKELQKEKSFSLVSVRLWCCRGICVAGRVNATVGCSPTGDVLAYACSASLLLARPTSLFVGFWHIPSQYLGNADPCRCMATNQRQSLWEMLLLEILTARTLLVSVSIQEHSSDEKYLQNCPPKVITRFVTSNCLDVYHLTNYE